jgi:4-aminobutyrate aminotransferase-like enzyme
MELEPEADQDALVQIHREMFEKGFIIGVKPAFFTLRFYPPLIIDKERIDQLVNALDEVLKCRIRGVIS